MPLLRDNIESLKGFRDLKGVVDTSFEDGEKSGLEKGLAQGIEKGIEKGKKEQSIEVAKKMKSKGTDIEFISEVTGLSKAEIETL